MSAATLHDLLSRHRATVERSLDELLPSECGSPTDVGATLIEAMRFAVGADGKRFRPTLALLVAEVFGEAGAARVRAFGSAVEFLHTASIVIDDLPSMDDADVRRGRPTIHRAYDEATAILVSDSLMMLAFETIALRCGAGSMDAALTLVAHAARAVGVRGMTAGQHADLTFSGAAASRELIERIHAHKTAPLFELAALGGALLSKAPEWAVDACAAYGRHLGIAFQIADDLIDATGEAELEGKRAHQDAGKPNAVAILGIDGAWECLDDHARSAKSALSRFGEEAQPLRDLIEIVSSRSRRSS